MAAGNPYTASQREEFPAVAAAVGVDNSHAQHVGQHDLDQAVQHILTAGALRGPLIEQQAQQGPADRLAFARVWTICNQTRAFVQRSDAVGAGKLDANELEIVALAASRANGCRYCVSAHTLLGKMAGLNPGQIGDARAGVGND